MSYWNETNRILERNGGRGPICFKCHTEMYPVDDHGRFGCKCNPFGPILSSSRIPQVPEGTKLTDKEKEKIPAMNRLHLTPTEEEKKFFEECSRRLWED